MSEIYWITRLNYIEGVSIATIVITGIVIVGCIINLCDATERGRIQIHKLLRYSIPSFVVALLTLCFVPNTKEALLIYGLGGTIDYMKNNDKAKQLPDKVVDALTRYIDSIEQDGKEKE